MAEVDTIHVATNIDCSKLICNLRRQTSPVTTRVSWLISLSMLIGNRTATHQTFDRCDSRSAEMFFSDPRLLPRSCTLAQDGFWLSTPAEETNVNFSAWTDSDWTENCWKHLVDMLGHDSTRAFYFHQKNQCSHLRVLTKMRLNISRLCRLTFTALRPAGPGFVLCGSRETKPRHQSSLRRCSLTGRRNHGHYSHIFGSEAR